MINRWKIARRGGYCFEQNGVFERVLRELGFNVRSLLGRVVLSNPPALPPRTHRLLLVELEGESTFRYMETLCRLGYSIPELSPSLCHIIASGMLGGLVEIVVHDIPQEQALRDVEQLREFYTAGWLKLMSP